MVNGEWGFLFARPEYPEEEAGVSTGNISVPLVEHNNLDRQWSQKVHLARCYFTQRLHKYNIKRAKYGKPPCMWDSEYRQLRKLHSEPNQHINNNTLLEFISKNNISHTCENILEDEITANIPFHCDDQVSVSHSNEEQDARNWYAELPIPVESDGIDPRWGPIHTYHTRTFCNHEEFSVFPFQSHSNPPVC